MSTIDDIHGFGEQFTNQLQRLEEADIDEADRKAIRSFIRHQDVQRGLAASTLVNNLSHLRLSAQRSDTPLTEMDREDVDGLLFRYKHEREYSEGTLRNYRKAFRKFFRYRGHDWAESIEIGSVPKREVNADKVLSKDDITALRDAARNPRDKALIEMLVDTGLRIGALGSLRVGDVQIGHRAGVVKLNEDAAGRKGASGKLPITYSKPYVANWLDVHPRPDDPEAPLFHTFKREDDEQYGDGSLTYYQLQRRLKRLADDAGVDRDKVNPHNFRKTAITRWIRQGFSEQEIKHRATWVKDSRQFETYSQVTDEEMNQQILAKSGLAEQDADHAPELDKCPQCQSALQDDPQFCPGCGLALNQRAALNLEKAEDDLFEDMAETTDSDQIEMLRDLRALLKENPEALSGALSTGE
ncbi:tyrosine-type recombinase/integrase [Halogranum rubrum]|uniref:Integrase family protein n=1 Tax=Halogranum salarium B-1 TaxID=1210908 RepID=J3EYJ8_9EURY|nr:tyrosine-type recombinase/integrase [Halogranum salarium]EJN60457.1 integrase family protein [Halogranum salarium B-1]